MVAVLFKDKGRSLAKQVSFPLTEGRKAERLTGFENTKISRDIRKATPTAFLFDNDHMALLGITVPALRKLAVPFVCAIISFLSYSSQYLFYHIEPGPLTPIEAAWFNTLVFCILYSYERACRVDPGRLPKSLAGDGAQDGPETAKAADEPAKEQRVGNWCKKCDAVKPPRAHHCRLCNR